MAVTLPPSMMRLISLFSTLQGIGPRMARRLVLQLLRGDPKRLRDMAESLAALHQRVRPCAACGFLTEEGLDCPVCSDRGRDRSLLCVVEESQDVLVIENTGQFNGMYHVLGGVLSPMDGIGPAQLRMKELLERLKQADVREVIVATNPNMEGDATALFLKETLSPTGIRVTRLARGVPTGGDLEYADSSTLGSALEGRAEY